MLTEPVYLPLSMLTVVTLMRWASPLKPLHFITRNTRLRHTAQPLRLAAHQSLLQIVRFGVRTEARTQTQEMMGFI